MNINIPKTQFSKVPQTSMYSEGYIILKQWNSLIGLVIPCDQTLNMIFDPQTVYWTVKVFITYTQKSMVNIVPLGREDDY